MIFVWPEGGCDAGIQGTGANRVVRDHDVCSSRMEGVYRYLEVMVDSWTANLSRPLHRTNGTRSSLDLYV